MPQYGMGFQNPYGFMPQNNNLQPQSTVNNYDYVNGYEGMKNYPVQPNSSILLIDRSYPFAYLKTANAMGQNAVQFFKLEEVEEKFVKENMQNVGGDYLTKKDIESIISPILQRLDRLDKEKGEQK